MKVFMFFITSGFCVEEACCFGEPGSWSSCDKSCEGGQRRRHKELFGINNDMVLAGSMWLAGECPLYEAPCINHQYDYEGCNYARCRKFMFVRRFI